MKRIKKILITTVAGMLAVVSLLFLAGCQQEPKPAEQSDVDIMQETYGNSNTDPFYVLVIGNDSRIGTVEIDKPEYADGTGRSDTMMLVRVDPVTYHISLVTVPRDTETIVNSGVTKINEIYRTGGAEAAIAAVEELTGARAKYYLDMGFVDFEQFVDQLGGVTASVPIDMHLKDIVSGSNVELAAGSQALDGSQALVLARVRKLYAADIEACRQIQDRQIVEEAIKKVAADPAKAASHATILSSVAKTNWPAEELSNVVVDFAENADKITFSSGTGPYVGSFMDEYDGMWLTPRDEDTWRKVIEVVDKGGDPTTVVPLPEVEAA